MIQTNPHEFTDHQSTLIDLRAALERLTDSQRRVLTMWVLGYTQEEIGREEGVTRRAIGYRLQTIMANLREFID